MYGLCVPLTYMYLHLCHQLVQIWINIHHLEGACEHLDKYTATVTKCVL